MKEPIIGLRAHPWVDESVVIVAEREITVQVENNVAIDVSNEVALGLL